MEVFVKQEPEVEYLLLLLPADHQDDIKPSIVTMKNFSLTLRKFDVALRNKVKWFEIFCVCECGHATRRECDLNLHKSTRSHAKKLISTFILSENHRSTRSLTLKKETCVRYEDRSTIVKNEKKMLKHPLNLKLNEHQTGEKMECKVCKSSFKYYHSYKRHVSKVSRQCNECQLSFKCWILFRKHVKEAHAHQRQSPKAGVMNSSDQAISSPLGDIECIDLTELSCDKPNSKQIAAKAPNNNKLQKDDYECESKSVPSGVILSRGAIRYHQPTANIKIPLDSRTTIACDFCEKIFLLGLICLRIDAICTAILLSCVASANFDLKIRKISIGIISSPMANQEFNWFIRNSITITRTAGRSLRQFRTKISFEQMIMNAKEKRPKSISRSYWISISSAG